VKIFGGLQSYPANGQFNIHMFSAGHEVVVHIDDRLPGSVNTLGQLNPVYSKRTADGAWYVPILEKAAAKYYGTYNRIVGGWMTEALYAFTGMPSYEIARTSANLWEALSEWDSKNYIMSAGVSCLDPTNVNYYNLVCGHAYSTIGVATYNG
jgi:hypothetical protein